MTRSDAGISLDNTIAVIRSRKSKDTVQWSKEKG